MVFRSVWTAAQCEDIARLRGTQMSASTQQIRSDNAGEKSWEYTDEIELIGWSRVYATVSELFFDLENCPVIFGLAAKTSRDREILQRLLHRWRSADRPNIGWPKQEDSSSLAPLTTPLPFAVEAEENHSHPDQ